MNNIKLLVYSITIPLVALSTHAQGSFENLNFEQANPITYPGSFYITAASGLPDWTVDYGGVTQTYIAYNAESTGATQVSLIGTGAEPYYSPIDGNYSVFLTGGGTSGGASISQSGVIQSGIQSLYFEAELGTYGAGELDVSIDGQNVPYVAVSTGPNYTLYGANVSTWAGTGTAEPLIFTAPAIPGGLNGWEIDDISFSTVAITPEPSILILTALTGIGFGVRKWFAQR